MLTAHGTIDHGVQAIKDGADQFLTKPIDLDALVSCWSGCWRPAQPPEAARLAHARRRCRPPSSAPAR